MNLRVFPIMHTFHPAEEDGTMTRQRTGISLKPGDQDLDEGVQIDLETQQKAATSILAQGEAMAIPEK